MKATWFFSDGSSYTTGASNSDIRELVFAGHKVAKRRKVKLVGWHFIGRPLFRA
jgi:hypothetical protein